jgi:hypothetical protein
LTERSGLEDVFLILAKPTFPPSMAVKPDAKLRTGESLSLKISEEPVQLKFSCPTDFRNDGAKSSNQLLGKSELIGQLTLKVFGKCPVRSRIQGVVGLGLKTSGYPIIILLML